MKTFEIIGMMSGTSLDGVDLAHCTFQEMNGKYTFDLGCCETIPYPVSWLDRLKELPQTSAMEYAETHVAYGRYIGQLIKNFIDTNLLSADFVASHGHTIFHNPDKLYTAQIGDGAAISMGCDLPVVCDFRSSDVAANGQGAPLVPFGDELLFPEYDYCLNLGGFANISTNIDGKRIAFDISPANIVLNFIANKAGKPFDEDGKLAASGKTDAELLAKLNNLDFYKKQPPKSLGREWVEKHIIPLLNQSVLSLEDIAHTFCHHIAIQIAACIEKGRGNKMLITGGGAFNAFLIKKIRENADIELVIPDAKTINYKEALVFAFLGLLRMQALPNCLASVTGASHNVIGGAVYLPGKSKF
ncbi:MAG: anhydro-N-acetylmuramic acid kinase [Bacteroidales bacterium]